MLGDYLRLGLKCRRAVAQNICTGVASKGRVRVVQQSELLIVGLRCSLLVPVPCDAVPCGEPGYVRCDMGHGGGVEGQDGLAGNDTVWPCIGKDALSCELHSAPCRGSSEKVGLDAPLQFVLLLDSDLDLRSALSSSPKRPAHCVTSARPPPQ